MTMLNIENPASHVEALNAAFDQTQITFNDRAASLAKFRETHEITFDENGDPFAVYDAKLLPLAESFTRFAFDNRDHVDGRSLPRTSESGARSVVDAKSNYPTVAQRVEFIKTFGDQKWAELPMKAPEPVEEIRYQDQFRSLTLAQKSALIAQHGSDYVSMLPHRPDPNRAAGSFINHELIARQKKICPSRS